MKEILGLGIAIILMVSCNFANHDYKIEGDLGKDINGTIVLNEFIDRTLTPLDSTKVVKGKFVLSGNLKYETMVRLTMKGQKRVDNIFIIEKNTQYKAKMNKNGWLKVHGGLANEIQEKYFAVTELFYKENKAEGEKFYKAMDAKDDAALEKSYDEFHRQNVKRQERTYKIFKEHKDNIASLLHMYNSSHSMTVAFMEKLYSELTEKQKKHKLIIAFKKKLDNRKPTAVGSIAPDFTVVDPEGNKISLSEIKGKVKVIDFWASWCGPCREANRAMKKIYAKYHDKGLECFSISLDEVDDMWRKAIKEDKLPWQMAVEPKGLKSEITTKYNISAIPFIMVLDENNKILGRQLFEPQVKRFIKEILGE